MMFFGIRGLGAFALQPISTITSVTQPASSTSVAPSMTMMPAATAPLPYCDDLGCPGTSSCIAYGNCNCNGKACQVGSSAPAPATTTVQPAPTSMPVDPSTLPYCSTFGCTGSMMCTSVGVCMCNGSQCQRDPVALPPPPPAPSPTPLPAPSPTPTPVSTGGGSSSGSGSTYPPACPPGTEWDDASSSCLAYSTAGPSVTASPPVMVDPTTGAVTPIDPTTGLPMTPPMSTGMKIALGALGIGTVVMIGLAIRKYAA